MTTTIKTLDEAEISKAITHLQAVDCEMGALIARVDQRPPIANSDGSHFDAIVRTIVFQQLSGRVAETIHRRVTDMFDGKSPTPQQLDSIEEDRLRAAGLSRQKAAYLKDLASKCISGELLVENLHEFEDEVVIEQLTQVKGIGKWTAQMFLLFRLGRADILSELDLGMRKAIQRLYNLPESPSYEQVVEIGKKWAPYRSVASWYLWRSLE